MKRVRFSREILTRLPLGLMSLLLVAPGAAAQNYAAADMRKAIIEYPTAKLLRSSDFVTNTAPKAATDADHVLPGIVSWHSNYDEAVKAAAASGKPVLLFQLMGNLDEKFC